MGGVGLKSLGRKTGGLEYGLLASQESPAQAASQ